MESITLMFTAIAHTISGALRRALQHDPSGEGGRDSGQSVSLETVLWIVAVGVAVVVIAAIVYTKIKNEANTPIQAPTAP